jgi:hypothetical protein
MTVLDLTRQRRYELEVQKQIWRSSFYSRERLQRDLLTLYLQAAPQFDNRPLPKQYLAEVIQIIGELYETEFPSELPENEQERHLKKLISPSDAYLVFLKAFLRSLIAFTQNFPASARVLLSPELPPLFQSPLPIFSDEEHFTPELHTAFEALKQPLLEATTHFSKYGIFNPDTFVPYAWYPFDETKPRFRYDEFSEGEPIYGDQYERRHWRERKRRHEQQERRRKEDWKESDLDFWEREKRSYEEAHKEVRKNTLAWQQTFHHSPLQNFCGRLIPNGIKVPFEIPPERWFEGTWVTAPQGSGKTNLLRHIVLHQLQHGSIILIDPKGDLIRSFQYLAPIKDRLVVLEPNLEYPLALNPLDIGGSAQEILEYLFSIFNTEMTPLQATLFSQVLKLLDLIPNATLDTFLQILATGVGQYEQYVRALAPRDQTFFDREFNQRQYNERKPEISWRIRSLLNNPYLVAMFTSPTTKINMSELMDGGKIVCINNNYDTLTPSGSEFMGRFFLALIWYAARRRHSQTPVYVVIDEAHFVIANDHNIERMITQLRSKKIGLIFAHQQFGQIKNEAVASSLKDCAIKFTNSTGEAYALAPFFDTTTEFLKSQEIGSFACHVKFKTRSAVSLSVPHYRVRKPDETFVDSPVISDYEFHALMQTMRARYANNFPEPHFLGYDVQWECTISPKVAQDGGTRIIHGLKIVIRPGTAHGVRLRIRGKGALKPDGTFGDAILTVHIGGYTKTYPQQYRISEVRDDR